jgi:hypothetical protein
MLGIGLGQHVAVPLVIEAPSGTIRTATWTQNGAVYAAVYVDLEWSESYDLSLHRLDVEAASWQGVWSKSYPVGADAAADRTWEHLLTDPAGYVPADLR